MQTLLQHPQFAGSWRMLVAMLLSGTIGLFVVESGQDTATVVFYRCLLGGAALLAYLSWQRGWQKLSARQSGYLLAGGFALVANWFCLFGAYKLSSISIATLVYHTQPFFLLLLTAFGTKQWPPAAKWGWPALSVGALVTLGLVHTGLMYNLMYSAFQRLPVTSIAFLSFVYPLLTVLIDFWYYDLTLSLSQYGGMALIVLALIAHQRNWGVRS